MSLAGYLILISISWFIACLTFRETRFAAGNLRIVMLIVGGIGGLLFSLAAIAVLLLEIWSRGP